MMSTVTLNFCSNKVPGEALWLICTTCDFRIKKLNMISCHFVFFFFFPNKMNWFFKVISNNSAKKKKKKMKNSAYILPIYHLFVLKIGEQIRSYHPLEYICVTELSIPVDPQTVQLQGDPDSCWRYPFYQWQKHSKTKRPMVSKESKESKKSFQFSLYLSFKMNGKCWES